MPIIGLLLGRQLAHALGSQAQLIGGGLLILTGAFTVLQASKDSDAVPSAIDVRNGSLMLMPAGLSIDNLIVGFALGAYHVPLALAIALIAVISVGLSLVGLELGQQLGAHVEHDSEFLAGIVLISVGAAIALGLL